MSRSTDSAARGLGNSELAIKTLCAVRVTYIVILDYVRK